ncbi:unnamed protein product [Boreogadus saida]
MCQKEVESSERHEVSRTSQHHSNVFPIILSDLSGSELTNTVPARKQNWKGSRNDCLQRNADLVVINSRREKEFTSSIGKHWIGLSDRETEGEWKWVDGSGLTFRNWRKDEPDGGDKISECAEQHGRELPNWNDAFCNRPNFWICEKAADP